MYVFSDPILIKAHQDINRPYYNHSYDRQIRDARCGKCFSVIGRQVRYEGESRYSFENTVMNDYKYCPYCGEILRADK